MDFKLDALIRASAAAVGGAGRLLLAQCFNDYRGRTTLVLENYLSGSPSPDAFLIISCNVPCGTLRVAELPAEVKSVAISQDHPLLLPYRPEHYEIYIAGRPVDANAAYDSLKDVIVRHAADWIPPDSLIGSRTSALKLLAGGFGMLGKAPPPLAFQLRDSLLDLGCSPSLLTAAPEEQPSSFDEAHLRVLVLDPAATLLISSATCRRTTNEATVSALIRKHRGW